jgi:hypothetical protein
MPARKARPFFFDTVHTASAAFAAIGANIKPAPINTAGSRPIAFLISGTT